jgi:hypothetical protein
VYGVQTWLVKQPVATSSAVTTVVTVIARWCLFLRADVLLRGVMWGTF